MIVAATFVASWAERYTAFVERREVAWELAMGAMAALFVVVGFAADDATGSLAGALLQVELVLTAIFVAEFGSRIAATPDRLAYLKGHWIDLVALIPSVRQVRMLRPLRLLLWCGRSHRSIARCSTSSGCSCIGR
jgi:voltage-gated potassium channel